MRSNADRRITRALSFSVIAVVLALAGHSAASGLLPGLLPSIAIIVVAAAAALGFTRHSRGIAGTAAFLVALQAISHVTLWATAHHGHDDTAHASALLPSPMMVAAHVAAALIAAWLLTRMDAVACSWVALWSAVLGAVHITLEVPEVASGIASREATHAIEFRHQHAVVRRGPPGFRAVAMTG